MSEHTIETDDVTDISGASDNLTDFVKEELRDQNEMEPTRPLEKRMIGISISESEEIEQLGLSDIHQRDFMIEVARHLLVQGATLAYGGDLRQGGYTYLLSELSFQYRNRNDRDRYPFRNYFSYPIHINLTNSDRANFKKNRVETVFVPAAPELTIQTSEFIKPNTLNGKYIWARSLTYMRQQMDAETDARIFIGGRNFNYQGRYPGIVEEAYLALQSEKPVYLVGAFGGATLRMIQALSGSNVVDTNTPFYQSEDQQNFFEYHNEQAPDKYVSFDELNSFFKSMTIETFSDINGLTIEENQRLFVTPHLPEIVYLILKGLSNRLNNHS